MQEPRAEKRPKELSIHGDTRIDNYYWLNQRENKDVLSYLSAENQYTAERMKSTEQLQETLYKEIVGRIKEDDESVPYFKNGYWYYSRYVSGKEYPLYCRKPVDLDHQEEVMLDVNELAEGKDYFHVAGLSVSADNTMLAFGEDTLGRRIYTLKVKNLETGSMMDIEVPGTSASIAWADDNRTLFYALRDDQTLRSYKVNSVDLFTGNIHEKFEERDETFYCSVYKSKSQKFIIVSSGSTLTSEYRYLPADSPLDNFEIFQERIRGMEYGISHYEDQWYILTNWDAQNFKLMTCPLLHTTRDNWEQLIGHRKDTLLEGIEIFKDHLVVEERTKGLSHLRIIEHKGKTEHYLPFEEETYSCWTAINPDFNSEVLRFGYTSLTVPTSVYDYNMNTGEKTLLKQQEVVGGYDETLYEAKRIEVKARDGVMVPVSLVYRKDKLKSPNPLVLYGYGSYGHSMDPYFSTSRLSLLDRGFIWAIAHIRGGEDLGRAWYEDGKLLKKKNTFTDFIDSAETLIELGYTQREHLYAMGGSAGGLLMGAILNLKPELWNGVIAAVPFVDVVTTMLDESIPLTTGEYDEWGNPNEREYYDYIKSYSPYDNVKATDYPNILVTTGLHDSQVQYWEPAKWVAKLREMRTNDKLLLLHTNMETGHSGASGRFAVHKETAMDYAFLLMLEGINS
ncbi:S9 family peptidase [bacterium]|nr:S9 family peptidase [bacterium]